MEFLAASMTLDEAAAVVAKEPYSRFPVYQESYDDVTGFIHVRDLLDPGRRTSQLTVGEIGRPVKLLPISKTVLSALSEMRRDRAHLAIVMDEYGGTAGIITLEDLVEELVGDIQDEYDVDEGQPKQLRGGAIEVDGLLNLDEFAEQTGIELPEGPYETVAGYMLAVLGQLPSRPREGRGGRARADRAADGRPAHRPGPGGPGLSRPPSHRPNHRRRRPPGRRPPWMATAGWTGLMGHRPLIRRPRPARPRPARPRPPAAPSPAAPDPVRAAGRRGPVDWRFSREGAACRPAATSTPSWSSTSGPSTRS